MKKKVILRSLIGAPIGLSISFIITLIISVIINKGEYYPVMPKLTALCGNELNAVVIQTVCSLIYGAMPHNFWGIAGYIAIFFFIYFFIWFSQYFAMKKRIQEFNNKVKSDSVNN